MISCPKSLGWRLSEEYLLDISELEKSNCDKDKFNIGIL